MSASYLISAAGAPNKNSAEASIETLPPGLVFSLSAFTVTRILSGTNSSTLNLYEPIN